MRSLRPLLVLALGFALVAWTAALVNLAVAAPKAPQVFTGIMSGVAVGGYDPVAYFTDGKPVPGRADITLQHAGATWRFASAENRAQFAADPAKYAPQYGGHCAWAVAQGYTAKGDPSAWKIIGGKLYLNYNADIQKRWEGQAAANISKADGHWPKLTAE